MNKLELKNIDENIIAKYLGYKGNVPDERVVDIIKLCKQDIVSRAFPKCIYKVFDFDITDEGVIIMGTSLILTGDSIKRLLSKSKKAILLCATLGIEIDKYIKQCKVEDLTKAVVADATASVAIDAFCDEIEKEVKSQYKDSNLTYRFGIGYGDLPLDLEPLFLKVLNAENMIGVSTSESYILNPRKTVACIIGLSTE